MSERISAVEVFGEAFQPLWDNKEVFLLLGSLVAIANLIYIWPFMDVYVQSFEALMGGPDGMSSTEVPQLNPVEMKYYLYTIIPYLFLMVVPMVIWLRVILSGRSKALEGGLKALLSRVGWGFWRYINLIGYMIVVFGALFLIVFILSAALGYAGGESMVPLLFFLVIPLYAVIFYVTAILMVMFFMSLACEVQDIRLPLHKSFALLKGNMARAAGFLVLAMFGFMVVYFMIFGMLVGLLSIAPSWIMMGVFFLLFMLGVVFNFVTLGFGAGYARRLVPELQKS